ncbi:zinc finger protein 853-like [Nylanderia fulva]|uniref:zinc finger protein 853-like n=1 Tax=Nylanderia fulva TaxID=613905 RepID=UPI0010FB83EA|nr:zinc finger protein 853-like [Nylanderia fulva]
MLHGALPRAFLAPGLSYMSYYSEEIHHPAYVAPPTTWHIPMDDPSSPIYSRIPAAEHHASLQSWESSRSSTPCPLDLSLKPPPTPNTPKTEEIIEVGDEKDLRIREEIQTHVEGRRDSEEEQQLIVDDLDTLRTSSAQSHQSQYERLMLNKESARFHDSLIDKIHHLPEESTRLSSYPGNELAAKYQLHSQKLLLSPTHMQSMQSYHQQLLLTPQQHLQSVHAPMTPPSTPSPPQCPRRRVREEDLISPSGSSLSTPKQTGNEKTQAHRPKKKHARRLKFDEDTSSPVSGTVILGPDEAVVTGDIDPAFNIVEVTEEARAELAKIENRLGPYQCKLCRQLHEDAFQLAQHRCSRIAHVEYRCPECDKRFSCPANLASHRRWHKPRLPNADSGSSATSSSSPSSSSSSSSSGTTAEIPCTRCEAKFTRQAALRKHLATQHPETNNNVSSSNNNNNVHDGQETVGKADIAQTAVNSQLANEMT